MSELAHSMDYRKAGKAAVQLWYAQRANRPHDVPIAGMWQRYVDKEGKREVQHLDDVRDAMQRLSQIYPECYKLIVIWAALNTEKPPRGVKEAGQLAGVGKGKANIQYNVALHIVGFWLGVKPPD